MLSNIKKHFLENIFLWLSLLVTFIIYFKSLHFPFISWDDPEMVYKNYDVRTFNFKELISNHYVGNYIPLAMLSHAFAWLLFKSNVVGHHSLSLLLHLFNGYLIYKLTLLLFKEKQIAIVTIIIFLLHPIQSESLNWVSELKNILYATFFILSLISYANFKINTSKSGLYFTYLFFILSCLSKPAAVVLPLALFCIDLLNDKRFTKNQFLYKIPFFFLSLLFGLINLKTQAADQFINHAHSFPFIERISNAGFAVFNYLKLVFIPFNLSVIYPFPAHSTLLFAFGLTCVLCLFFALYKSYKKNIKVFVSLLFFLINLMLVVQLVPFGEVLNADRYMYVSIIGLAWLFSIGVSAFTSKSIFTSIILVLVLSPLTYLRSNQWKSSISLYEDIVKKYPDNFLALNSLGVEYMIKDNSDKAFLYFNHAINVAPRNYKGYYNRALLHLKNNNPKRAIDDLNITLGMYDYHKAYVARASAYYSLLNYKLARNDAYTVLSKDKNNHRAYFILGNCDNDENNLVKAIEYYTNSINLTNQEADYFFKRAIAFGKQQQFTNCLSDLNTCIALNNNYFAAYYWRGVAKINLKQNACADFKYAAENNYQLAYEAVIKYCR